MLSSGEPLARRRFLALLAAAAGGGALAACGDDGGGAGPTGSTSSSTTPPAPATLAEALGVLAAAVRRSAPDLAPLDLPGDPAADLDGVVAALDEAAARDLADGAVVEVAGWILSVTEARLCLAAA